MICSFGDIATEVAITTAIAGVVACAAGDRDRAAGGHKCAAVFGLTVDGEVW